MHLLGMIDRAGFSYAACGRLIKRDEMTVEVEKVTCPICQGLKLRFGYNR
jgi:hypothetical protein